MQRIEPHPAYAKSALASRELRAYLAGDALIRQARRPSPPEFIYQLEELEDPPLHFPLGKDALGAAKARIANSQAVVVLVDKWAPWSDRDSLVA